MGPDALARPMLGSILAKTVREQRRGLLWWGLGVVVTAATYAAFYPSVARNANAISIYLKTFPETLQRAFFGSGGDFFTPGGYLQTELFGFFGPMLLLVFTIGAGARAIAGEEERRSLDILLSTPVTRRHVVTHKAIALVAGAALLSAVLWVALVVLGPPFDLTPGVGNLGAAIVMLLLLAVAFGMVALAAGCWSGRRGRAIGLAGGAAAAMWLLDVLAPTMERAAWLQRLSLFHYYNRNVPVKNGLDPVSVGLLLAVAVIAFFVARRSFDRRDLST